MYLGIDYLITRELKPYVVEVNVGLPGGAQEYDLTHRVRYGEPSDIFTRIEDISLRVYGKPFKEYLHSLPFIESLKPFKLWMDGQGPFPQTFHPGLRLEDKWVQYQLVKSIVPMPETVIFNPQDMKEAEAFLKRKGKLVLKRRLGRGGRGFKVIPDRAALSAPETGGFPSLLQEYVESKTEGYTFSIRATAFAGEFICLYANLSTRYHSNHGALTFVSTGNDFGLADRKFETEFFNQKSWEAELWFGKDAPPYLKHNLYEDEVARTILFLPVSLYQWITEASVKIERHYEGFDFSTLPEACFERR